MRWPPPWQPGGWLAECYALWVNNQHTRIAYRNQSDYQFVFLVQIYRYYSDQAIIPSNNLLESNKSFPLRRRSYVEAWYSGR